MKKRTSKTTKCLIFLSFLILISVVGITIYQKILYTPQRFFIEAMNCLKNDYKYVYNDNGSNYRFISNDFTYKGSLDINIQADFLNFLKKEKSIKNTSNIINVLNDMNLNYNFSKNNNKLLFELNSRNLNDELNFIYYKDNNNHYLKMKEFGEKFIKINKLVENLNNNIILINEKEYLIKFIIDSFIRNLDNKYFSKTNELITYNNQQINSIKNILTLDRKNISELLNNIINDIKNDKKATDLMLEIYPKFNDLEIKIEDNDIVLYFNTYIINNELIKYDIELANIKKYINNFDIENIKISFLKKENIIEIIIDEEKIISINLEKKEYGYHIAFYVNDSKIIELNVNNVGEEKNIEIKSGILSNNTFNVKLSEIFDKNTLEDFDKIENKLLFNINLFDLNLFKLDIKNSADIYDSSKIEMNLTEVIELNDLSKNDFYKIKEIITEFINNN